MVPAKGRALQRERGVALIACLMILLIMTALGVSAMRGAGLQERMAGGIRDRNVALQAAEAALREAEADLTEPSIGPFRNTNGLYEAPEDGDTARWKQIDWADSDDVREYSDVDGVTQPPKYIIERLETYVDAGIRTEADQPNRSADSYRITARGYGKSDDAVVVVQSTFRRE